MRTQIDQKYVVVYCVNILVKKLNILPFSDIHFMFEKGTMKCNE